MKRTIITAIACGAVMLAAACTAPQGAEPADSTQSRPASESAATGDESSQSRDMSSTPSEAASVVLDDGSAHTPNVPAPAGNAHDAGAPAEGTEQEGPRTPASRRGDGRARVGDPCPGLQGTQRPAVNGENLVCAGGPVPRWTVILDEPAPGGPSDQPGDPTEEPSVPSEGEGGGSVSGVDGAGTDRDGRDGAGPQSTSEPAAPVR